MSGLTEFPLNDFVIKINPQYFNSSCTAPDSILGF